MRVSEHAILMLTPGCNVYIDKDSEIDIWDYIQKRPQFQFTLNVQINKLSEKSQ